MLHFCDKFALSQSNATISVAYNSYCNLLLITSFVKQGTDICLLHYHKSVSKFY